jgi:hypothetical protein
MRLGALTTILLVACGGGNGSTNGDAGHDAVRDSPACGGCDAPNFPSTLDGNRDRLLHTYLVWLQADPNTAQQNGLIGRNLTNVCDLWNMLDPSSQDVFRTITHRLEGGTLGLGGTHMLDHVTKLYRLIGGAGASGSNPGSCGGGENNRMIMSMDAMLHDVQVTANTRKGASPYDIADIPSAGYWRDSHDLGGPHAPFDLSDETNDGAPRGQTQYFRDPTGTLAHQPLGRADLATLVDPYALEMDQDYDCTHNSNPSCDYTLYGPLCAPETSQAGTAIYTQNYGAFEPTWKPTGC